MIDDSVEKKSVSELFHFSSSFSFPYPPTFAQRSHKETHRINKHTLRVVAEKKLCRKNHIERYFDIQL